MKGLALILFLVACVVLAVLPHFVSESTWARGLGDKALVAVAILFLVLVRMGR